MATGRLAEVEEEAMRIQTKRFREDEEDRQYKLEKEAEKRDAEEAKAETAPSDKKGK